MIIDLILNRRDYCRFFILGFRLVIWRVYVERAIVRFLSLF